MSLILILLLVIRPSCATRRNEMRQMRRICVILIDFLVIASTTQWALNNYTGITPLQVTDQYVNYLRIS